LIGQRDPWVKKENPWVKEPDPYKRNTANSYDQRTIRTAPQESPLLILSGDPQPSDPASPKGGIPLAQAVSPRNRAAFVPGLQVMS